jgi:hypothetical protein
MDGLTNTRSARDIPWLRQDRQVKMPLPMGRGEQRVRRCGLTRKREHSGRRAMIGELLTRVVRPGDIDIFPFLSGPAPRNNAGNGEERTNGVNVGTPHGRVKGNVPDLGACQDPWAVPAAKPLRIKISYLSRRTIGGGAILLQDVGPQKGLEALRKVDVGEGARVGIMRPVGILVAAGID